jgi:DNA-binding MarR family transcriptional regulator
MAPSVRPQPDLPQDDRGDRPAVDRALPPPDGFLLEGHVGFLLRKAHQRHAAIFLEKASRAGLTPTQFAALCKMVELGRVTQNHLGRLVAMDPATIQGVVRRLTARGLIDRTNDPMDRRTAVLAPTEAGLALIGDAVACARRAHEAALAPLSDKEQRVFLALLNKMV